MPDKKSFKVLIVSSSGETKRIRYRNDPTKQGLSWYLNKSKDELTYEDLVKFIEDGWRLKTNNLRRFKETFFAREDTSWPVIISDTL